MMKEKKFIVTHFLDKLELSWSRWSRSTSRVSFLFSYIFLSVCLSGCLFSLLFLYELTEIKCVLFFSCFSVFNTHNSITFCMCGIYHCWTFHNKSYQISPLTFLLCSYLSSLPSILDVCLFPYLSLFSFSFQRLKLYFWNSSFTS